MEQLSLSQGNWKSTLIKSVVSVGALVIIFWKIGIGSVIERCAGLSMGWVLAAVGCILGSIAVSAWKWQICAKSLDLPHGFWQLIRYYFIGFFFNNFLPSSVGGDVVRVWKLGASPVDNMPGAAASVVGERLVALFTPTALLGIAFCSLPTVTSKVAVWLAVLVPMIAAGALAVILRNPKLGEKTMQGAAGTQFGSVKEWTITAARQMGAFLRKPKVLIQVVLLTAFFQIWVAGVNYCLLRALDVRIGLGEALVYSCVALAVSMLPVTIAGHGMREVAYWYFFGLAGVAKADAVSTSLLFAILVALVTLPGALFFVLDKRVASTKVNTTEKDD